MIEKMTDQMLVEKLEKLVGLEKQTTAEILEYIKEVDRRRLYLQLGHTSLFSYLTRALKYTPSSAQRRIDSARLLKEIPELRQDLKSGSLNLMQISMMAQSFRQKRIQEKSNQLESPTPHPPTPTRLHQDSLNQKKEILTKIRNQDLSSTQKILAEFLDLPLQQFEVQRIQKDESVRFEITFSKEQMADLNRAKELLSHTHPHLKWADLFLLLTKSFLIQKDPLKKTAVTQKKNRSLPAPDTPKGDKTPTAKMDAETRKHIPTSVRRQVFRRDRSCQWKDSKTQEICGSKFQLQIDHCKPRWAGGTNDLENLQLLCASHNQMKYRQEAGLRFRGGPD